MSLTILTTLQVFDQIPPQTTHPGTRYRVVDLQSDMSSEALLSKTLLLARKRHFIGLKQSLHQILGIHLMRGEIDNFAQGNHAS